MSLDIQETTREDIVILTLAGRLTFGEADSIRDRIRTLGAAGQLKVVLDLSNVLYIDSTGLGAMVGGLTSLKKLGGALKLVNPSERNLELLLVTQLHTVFEVFHGVQDAVDSFSPHRTVQQFDFLKFFKKAAGRPAGQ
jgi:anti-sigma B factor antagonist